MIAASISPAISAATAKGLRGIKMNCMSRPCFLNNPRSHATHTAVMLSLVTLDDKFDLTCAFRNRGAQRKSSSRLARSRGGNARKALRITTVFIGEPRRNHSLQWGAVNRSPTQLYERDEKCSAIRN